MRLCFDIETDNLLKEATVVHCIATENLDTGESRLFTAYPDLPRDGSLEDGLRYLSEADELWGHNISSFDIPALKKIRGWQPSEHTAILDSYIYSLLAFPDLKNLDFKRRKAQAKAGEEQFPGNLCGQYNLKAWGARLGEAKGSYGDNRKDWSTYDEDMGKYCLQDVRTNAVLIRRLGREVGRVPGNLLEVEQYLHTIMSKQEDHGFWVDQDHLTSLISLMETERAAAEDKLQDLFPPRTVVYYTPKKRLRREKTIVFNPGSRQQIARNLIEKYGWEPKEFTPGGAPKVDEKVLGALPYPEAKELTEYLLLGKRLGQITEGKQAWLKKIDADSRIHPRTIVVGTPHGRCAHKNPNIAQIPAVGKKYGKECREAFGPTPGLVQVGCDASGIQLRALAHYLARYDGGAYVKVVTEGDPHTANQEAAGLKTRHDAKTFIYSFLFGAGDQHIGFQLGAPVGNGKLARNKGRATRARFLRGMPALARVIEDLKVAWESRGGKDGGYITGLDGRYIPVGSDHTLLNYLLTGFEVAVMKRAHWILHKELESMGWEWGVDYAQLAFVHDEYQFECPEDRAELLGSKAVWAIRKAGEDLGSRCPLDGEYKIGHSWYECH